MPSHWLSDVTLYGSVDEVREGVAKWIDAGVRYLKSLLGEFELGQALAAYNAGPNAVRKFGGIPPYRETQDYVRRVLSNLPVRP